VILSLQLSFAVIPLVIFTGSRKKMGEFVNGPWLQALSWFVAALIAGLNGWFLVMMLR
jgi:manganese transport protein